MNTKRDKNKPIETCRGKLAADWVTNLIAILAFGISVISLLKSCDANKITKTPELPCFKLVVNFNNSKDEILIYNEGGKLRELENPNIYLFWNIASDKTLMDEQEIAVVNYYNLGSRDPLLLGATPVKISASDSAKAGVLRDGFEKLAKENNLLAFISAKWYVRLQYKDIYDDSHDDMYDVSPIGAKKMSKNEAMKLIKKYTQKIEQGMDIDMNTASAEILYEKWKDLSRAKKISVK